LPRLTSSVALLLIAVSGVGAAGPFPAPMLNGLKNPAAVTVGPDGQAYVTVRGGVVVVRGKAVPFATGLDEPAGLVGWQQWLFVADRNRVWRIDRTGKATVFAGPGAFPSPPRALSAIDVDEEGKLYVADAGARPGEGTVFRIDPKGAVSLVTDARRAPGVKAPLGLVMDGLSFVLVLDASGDLYRVKVADGTATKVAGGFGSGGALAWDKYGRLYLADRKGGRMVVIPRPGDPAVALDARLDSPAGMTIDTTGQSLLVADAAAGTLTAVPVAIPGAPLDETPMPVEAAVAFPDLRWTGWSPTDDRGRVTPLRPIVLTHAGDGSDRVFVATEHGVIHVFPNDQKATQTKVFLDLRDRVVYDDNQNEEGFLGLAFHPRYKENGEFFAFYTRRKPQHTNVLSRFRVSKDDPNRADPASEEELLRVTHKYWNHDGGTVVFGPDGYLYLAVGDGGSANDPDKNGQNLGTLLGKVLRLDVDHKDPGKNYATPKDNPFVGRPGARPEVWAYGMRNPWRMAFDRTTGKLWTSDVGQNLYEEIDLITRGGNYGWSIREALHPFGPTGVDVRSDLVEPIWEYHHDVGKSNTGGLVYRGRRLPELQGMYVYADYVAGKVWALRYDEGLHRVVANRRIRAPQVPVLSFGEDEKGEAYFMTYTDTGRGLYWFVPSRPPEGKR
jgi:glucose/arabinose dehydrogenase